MRRASSTRASRVTWRVIASMPARGKAPVRSTSAAAGAITSAITAVRF
jgi:hypothetical protein